MAKADLQTRYNSILENEKSLTSYVAGRAIDKPQPALWMIVIPVFFVFYYFQFKRYKNGLKEFKRDFLKTRKQVLDAAHQAILDNDEIDIDELVTEGNPPEQAKEAYRSLVEELASFFRSLLEAEGSDYHSLVHSSYRKKSNYLIVLNRLDLVEKELNRALMPGLDTGDDRTTLAVEAIEKSSADFRKERARQIFSR